MLYLHACTFLSVYVVQYLGEDLSKFLILCFAGPWLVMTDSKGRSLPAMPEPVSPTTMKQPSDSPGGRTPGLWHCRQ